MLHKNEEKTEQNSASFRKPTSIERGLRPNGYFPLMRQPLSVTQGLAHGCDNLKKTTKRSQIKYMNFTFRDFDPISYMEKWHDMLDHSGGMCIKESVTSYDRIRMR